MDRGKKVKLRNHISSIKDRTKDIGHDNFTRPKIDKTSILDQQMFTKSVLIPSLRRRFMENGCNQPRFVF